MAFERRALGHRAHALVSTTLERAGFLAAFTERTGGTSPKPFDSLNLSLAVEDEAAKVRSNRARVVGGLGIAPFATAEQVHGTNAVRVGAKRAGAGFDDLGSRIPRTDALYTASAGFPLAVLTADCMPIVFASPAGGLVAVVHAGWRGMAAGILIRAAGLFDDPSDVRVAVGPAIGPCHYEVKEDVALAVASASEAGAVTDRRSGRLYLDLPGTARAHLRALGIRKVEDTGLCTACERARFYSHRRDRGTTGRQAGVAVRL
ncbi:MAG: peptidoglycan editing factor PgeF [Actinomycetota bacterium]|nr:peptidoglycan editing factor PgeF [Actinomycetota bacterium]